MQDAVVGIVSCAAGLLFIYGAATNNRFLLDLHKTRWIASSAGPAAARWIVGLIGIGLIVLGIAIIQGWRFPLFPEPPAKAQYESDPAATGGTPHPGRLALANGDRA